MFRCDNTLREMNLNSGRIAVFYCSTDTVTALALAKMDEVLDWLEENSAL